jgi:hypothetical protein
MPARLIVVSRKERVKSKERRKAAVMKMGRSRQFSCACGSEAVAALNTRAETKKHEVERWAVAPIL